MEIHDIMNLNDTDPSRKADILEWMIAQLLSDKPKLSEETLDEIRNYLADEGDEQLKREMDMVFLAALQTGRRDPSESPSPLIEDEWPKIARALGMNPDLNAYRPVPIQPTAPTEKKSMAEESWPAIARELGMNTDLNHYREIAKNRSLQEPQRRPLGRRLFLKAAAVLLPAAIVVGGYFLWDSQQTTSDDITITKRFVATATLETQADSIRHIVLSDGTEVILNRNSTFSYNDHREGELTGEAYFKVAKDPEHPFVIHSEELTVTVLGTEFNFRAHSGEEVSTLTLYEGTVQLNYAAGSGG